MADLPTLLLSSLDPASRKRAEQTLQSVSVQPGFSTHLLRLVLDPTADRSVRLAGSVYFKNWVRGRWEDEDSPVPEQEKETLRRELLGAMIALSAPHDAALRVQISESVSAIARFDFPERWGSFVGQLVSSLSPTDYAINLGVLETAHSVFKRWRAEVRSNELFTTINGVLSVFVDPFLAVFRQTATLILSSSSSPANPDAPSTIPKEQLKVIAQTQAVLVELFYDLTCQDLPPALEDAHREFFGEGDGFFLKLLAWDPVELRSEADDTSPSTPSQIKVAIFELAELYIMHFPELFAAGNGVDSFVRAVWGLVGGSSSSGNSNPSAGEKAAVAYDSLVAQALHFLSTTIRSGEHARIFGSRETVAGLVEGVVVPNVFLRDSDLEQFEDDPLEYTRVDLTGAVLSAGGVGGGTMAGGGGGEGTTRRQAAADVVKALVGVGGGASTVAADPANAEPSISTIATEIIGSWIQRGLAESNSAGGEKEKRVRAKDSAVYLFSAVAAKSATAQLGVTSQNPLVDVVQFFSDHVFADLQAGATGEGQGGAAVDALLQADAIRFLHNFRNQLTKDQLLSVLPLLARYLTPGTNPVCFTYAAITIERILFMKRGNALIFAQGDIHEIAPGILDALLRSVEVNDKPEKVAENDYIMKCIMRVIITARQTLIPIYADTLRRLITILATICKNPSNPNFDQYMFESLSGLMRFVVAGNPTTLATFEQELFEPITYILTQDIDQYIPYTFQLLAQMLELHSPSSVPATYRSLLPHLLTPAAWAQKGSIPGLVRLLKAYVAKDGKEMVRGGQVASVLAVVQQRLIPSKVNDVWGFELVQGVFGSVSAADIRPLMKPLLMTLLTRLQTSKTDKYTYGMVYFLLYTLALEHDGWTPDVLISSVEDVQPQLWSQILATFVIPEAPKLAAKDRKVAVVGLVRVLTISQAMVQPPNVSVWPATLSAIAKLFSEPQHLSSSDPTASEGFTLIDLEEQNAGYQVSYSRLAASESAPVDPVAYAGDVSVYVKNRLSTVGNLVGQAASQDASIAALASGLGL